MCHQGNAEETSRLWVELGRQRRDVRVSDENGKLLMEVRHGALTCWAADLPHGSHQRDLLEFLGQAAVYDEQQPDTTLDNPMPMNGCFGSSGLNRAAMAILPVRSGHS